MTEIWVDKAAGVNDIFHYSGSARGCTPLPDRERRLVVSPAVN